MTDREPRAIISRPSPNHGPRPVGTVIDCVVIHADAGRTDEGTLGWLSSRESKVSYHKLIGRDGRVYQCVPDSRRAWHAGVSSFEGRARCNDYSIGVAFANDQKGEPINDIQWRAGVEIVARLCEKHNIPLKRVTTHAVVSPGRKTDPDHPPGTFDLRRFVADVAERMAHTPPEAA